MIDAAFVRAAIALALPDPQPALLRTESIVAGFLHFGGGPVFSSTGPHRFYRPVGAERPELVRALADTWPDAAAFIAGIAADARVVLEVGAEAVRVFSDDLSGAVMCRCLDLPSGIQTTLVRTPAPPDTFRARAAALPIDGFWATRNQGSKPVGALLVNEARNQGDPELPAREVDAWTDLPGWHAARRLARDAGLIAFPDGLELLASGGYELTVGFCAPR